MKLSRKQKFILSWTIIALWILRPFIFRLLHIDFIEPDYLFYFKFIWVGLIPYALFQIIGRKSTRIATTIAVLSRIFIIFLTILSIMCGNMYSEPKYIHKYEKKEIRNRSY